MTLQKTVFFIFTAVKTCHLLFLFLFQDFPWIETDQQETELCSPNIVPIKTVDTGLLKLQMYVEESSEK
jgi:hypothetical protein